MFQFYLIFDFCFSYFSGLTLLTILTIGVLAFLQKRKMKRTGHCKQSLISNHYLIILHVLVWGHNWSSLFDFFPYKFWPQGEGNRRFEIMTSTLWGMRIVVSLEVHNMSSFLWWVDDYFLKQTLLLCIGYCSAFVTSGIIFHIFYW